MVSVEIANISSFSHDLIISVEFVCSGFFFAFTLMEKTTFSLCMCAYGSRVLDLYLSGFRWLHFSNIVSATQFNRFSIHTSFIQYTNSFILLSIYLQWNRSNVWFIWSSMVHIGWFFLSLFFLLWWFALFFILFLSLGLYFCLFLELSFFLSIVLTFFLSLFLTLSLSLSRPLSLSLAISRLFSLAHSRPCSLLLALFLELSQKPKNI